MDRGQDAFASERLLRQVPLYCFHEQTVEKSCPGEDSREKPVARMNAGYRAQVRAGAGHFPQQRVTGVGHDAFLPQRLQGGLDRLQSNRAGGGKRGLDDLLIFFRFQ